MKHGDLVIDLGNGIKTNAQLSLPAAGKGRNIVVRQKGIIYILPNGDIAMLMRNLECHNFVSNLLLAYLKKNLIAQVGWNSLIMNIK